MVQRNPESALHPIHRPPNISEETWRSALFAIIAIGSSHRAVLRTYPGPISTLAKIAWENPEIQLQFIDEKINSRKK